MDGINPTEVKSKAKSTDMLDIIEIEKNNAIRNLHAWLGIIATSW
jgi:hypothetical protein